MKPENFIFIVIEKKFNMLNHKNWMDLFIFICPLRINFLSYRNDQFHQNLCKHSTKISIIILIFTKITIFLQTVRFLETNLS